MGYGTDSDSRSRPDRRRNREAARARSGSWWVDRDNLVGNCRCVCGNVARADVGYLFDRPERRLDRIDHRGRATVADLPRNSWTETFAAGLKIAPLY